MGGLLAEDGGVNLIIVISLIIMITKGLVDELIGLKGRKRKERRAAGGQIGFPWQAGLVTMDLIESI